MAIAFFCGQDFAEKRGRSKVRPLDNSAHENLGVIGGGVFGDHSGLVVIGIPAQTPATGEGLAFLVFGQGDGNGRGGQPVKIKGNNVTGNSGRIKHGDPFGIDYNTEALSIGNKRGYWEGIGVFCGNGYNTANIPIPK